MIIVLFFIWCNRPCTPHQMIAFVFLLLLDFSSTFQSINIDYSPETEEKTMQCNPPPPQSLHRPLTMDTFPELKIQKPQCLHDQWRWHHWNAMGEGQHTHFFTFFQLSFPIFIFYATRPLPPLLPTWGRPNTFWQKAQEAPGCRMPPKLCSRSPRSSRNFLERYVLACTTVFFPHFFHHLPPLFPTDSTKDNITPLLVSSRCSRHFWMLHLANVFPLTSFFTSFCFSLTIFIRQRKEKRPAMPPSGSSAHLDSFSLLLFVFWQFLSGK